MKKAILFLMLFFAISVSNAFSQQQSFDERLLAKFSSEEISNMDSETLNFHTYCIENAFSIVPFPSEKEGDSAINGARRIDDLSSVNFFDLNVNLIEDKYQYFKILGTDKLLVIKPIMLINKEIK